MYLAMTTTTDRQQVFHHIEGSPFRIFQMVSLGGFRLLTTLTNPIGFLHRFQPNLPILRVPQILGVAPVGSWVKPPISN